MWSVTFSAAEPRWYWMAVPSGAFSPTQFLFPVTARLRRMSFFHSTASRGTNSSTSSANTESVTAWSAVTSSMIHTLRPWVASTRSLSRGWTRMSSIRTTGRLGMKRCQLPPSSNERNRPNSVPA